ncbi:MAG: hypothetical protein ACE5HP_12490 [Gemmatimonadota bacterium]
MARFCEELLAETGVLLLPGSAFSPRSSEFRIGLGRQELPGAMTRLEEYLEGRGPWA